MLLKGLKALKRILYFHLLTYPSIKQHVLRAYRMVGFSPGEGDTLVKKTRSSPWRVGCRWGSENTERHPDGVLAGGKCQGGKDQQRRGMGTVSKAGVGYAF